MTTDQITLPEPTPTTVPDVSAQRGLLNQFDPGTVVHVAHDACAIPSDPDILVKARELQGHIAEVISRDLSDNTVHVRSLSDSTLSSGWVNPSYLTKIVQTDETLEEVKQAALLRQRQAHVTPLMYADVPQTLRAERGRVTKNFDPLHPSRIYIITPRGQDWVEAALVVEEGGAPDITDVRQSYTAEDGNYRAWTARAAAFADGDQVVIHQNASTSKTPDEGYVISDFKGQRATVERQYDRHPSPLVTVRRNAVTNLIHSKWLVKVDDPAPTGASTPVGSTDTPVGSTEESRLRRELNDQRIAALRAEETLTEFKQRVYDLSKRLGREHGWCGVVDDALDDLGLGDLTETVQQRTYRVTVSFEVTASRSPEEDVSESFLGSSITLDDGDGLTIELDDDWEDAEFSFAEVAEVTDITGD